MMYLLEAMGVPWPVEIPLWLSGRLSLQGSTGFVTLVLVTWAATSLGNLAAFWLARLGGRLLLDRLTGRLAIREHLKRIERWLHRYGLWAAVGARWLNFGFGLSLWVLGFSGVAPRRVLPVMLTNNLLWACAWVCASRLLVRWMGATGAPDWLLLAPPASVVVGACLWRLLRERRVAAANG